MRKRKLFIFCRDYVSPIRSTAILLALLIIVILLAEFTYFDFFANKNKAIINLHAASLIVLTLALISVAWFQLNKLNDTSKGDFLLRVDDRFGSFEIIKARTIIHEFYCDTRLEGISIEAHIDKISDRIKDIGTIGKRAEDFIYLLNFLDFLETIAYFCEEKHISKRDIDKLLGDSVVYFYKIFRKWIDYRRQKYNKNYYCALEKLVEKLSPESERWS